MREASAEDDNWKLFAASRIILYRIPASFQIACIKRLAIGKKPSSPKKKKKIATFIGTIMFFQASPW